MAYYILEFVCLLSTGFLLSKGCDDNSPCPDRYECNNSNCLCKGNTGGANCSEECSTPCPKGTACVGKDNCKACKTCPSITSTCASNGTETECRCKDGYGGEFCRECVSSEVCSSMTETRCEEDFCDCPNSDHGAFCEYKVDCANGSKCNHGMCRFEHRGAKACYCLHNRSGNFCDAPAEGTTTTSEAAATTSEAAATTSEAAATTSEATNSTSDAVNATSIATNTASDATTVKCDPGERRPYPPNCYQFLECQVMNKWAIVSGCNITAGPFNNDTGKCDPTCVCRNVSCTKGCTAVQFYLEKLDYQETYNIFLGDQNIGDI